MLESNDSAKVEVEGMEAVAKAVAVDMFMQATNSHASCA